MKTKTYQLYKSETTGKYFVKFPLSEEKEITKVEYLYLLSQKENIFENFIKKDIINKYAF